MQLSVPVENLLLLDEVSKTVGKCRYLSRSMSNLRSGEDSSFEGVEDPAKGALMDGRNGNQAVVGVNVTVPEGVEKGHINSQTHLSTPDHSLREKRASSLSAGKKDRGLYEMNQLIPFACHTTTVSVV